METSRIKIPLKRDASGPEGCSDTSGMDWEFCIHQRSDYVTNVKDHRWASNRITLEFEWTVQGCTLREWRVVRKYGLFTFVFLHVFNFQTNVTIFVWKICSLNLLFMWLKELLLHKGSVKMDEYYGMFGALALIWKKSYFDLLFTFFSYKGKVTKIPSAHISLTYIHVFCSPY